MNLKIAGAEGLAITVCMLRCRRVEGGSGAAALLEPFQCGRLFGPGAAQECAKHLPMICAADSHASFGPFFPGFHGIHIRTIVSIMRLLVIPDLLAPESSGSGQVAWLSLDIEPSQPS